MELSANGVRPINALCHESWFRFCESDVGLVSGLL